MVQNEINDCITTSITGYHIIRKVVSDQFWMDNKQINLLEKQQHNDFINNFNPKLYYKSSLPKSNRISYYLLVIIQTKFLYQYTLYYYQN